MELHVFHMAFWDLHDFQQIIQSELDLIMYVFSRGPWTSPSSQPKLRGIWGLEIIDRRRGRHSRRDTYL
ncbi:hypothetical protein IFM61606_03914 [Aspergillus udagawae]|nr:hypothetical protein IFM61606_03914 [Aspergillus udagawae]